MRNLILLLLGVCFGCQSFRDHPAIVSDTLSTTIDTTLFSSGKLLSRASVRAFYASNDFSYNWIDKGILKPEGDSLVRFILQSGKVGLIPDDYHASEFEILLQDTLLADGQDRVDVFLTDAYLTVFEHLQNGRLDSKTLLRRDVSSRPNPQAVASLHQSDVNTLAKSLLAMEPRSREYHDLKAFLVKCEKDTLQRTRALTLALNMERWRWQKKFYDRYVMVNIPAFMLRVFEKDSLWFETKVIVGKRETPTPVMESVIRSFIIYPYWHVPYSISTKEILPALQADATYLKRNNFEVLDKRGKVILSDTIQWDYYGANNFPFILRQREGSENSMGIIKFVFNNNYGVYLHDTNSKRLYSLLKRDLSHGCVRVSNAVGFAHYLVREDDIYVSPEDLDQYLSLQQRHTIDLQKPIALRLDYFTAEVRSGQAYFHDDIYKKDSVMLQSLYAPAEKPPAQSAPIGL